MITKTICCAALLAIPAISSTLSMDSVLEKRDNECTAIATNGSDFICAQPAYAIDQGVQMHQIEDIDYISCMTACERNPLCGSTKFNFQKNTCGLYSAEIRMFSYRSTSPNTITDRECYELYGDCGVVAGSFEGPHQISEEPIYSSMVFPWAQGYYSTVPEPSLVNAKDIISRGFQANAQERYLGKVVSEHQYVKKPASQDGKQYLIGQLHNLDVFYFGQTLNLTIGSEIAVTYDYNFAKFIVNSKGSKLPKVYSISVQYCSTELDFLVLSTATARDQWNTRKSNFTTIPDDCYGDSAILVFIISPYQMQTLQRNDEDKNAMASWTAYVALDKVNVSRKA